MIGILSSDEAATVDWSGAEPFTLTYGEKGARLLTLPRAWTPPFALVPASAVAAIVGNPATDAVRELAQVAFRLAAQTGSLILRSSVVGESIWDRGTYKSVVIESAGSDLESSIRKAVVEIARSAPEMKCALILQSFVKTDEEGELGNLLRITRTRDHWEYSVRNDDSVVSVERINSQRDVSPSRDTPIKARVGLPRERLFGSIAAWINNDLLRGLRSRVNCEWIRRGDTFYIVQIDLEDEDIHGINPLQIDIEPSISTELGDGNLLKAGIGLRRNEWDKLKVLDDLDEGESRPPAPLFYVPVEKITSGGRQDLEADFQRFFGKNIVVRTSTVAGKKITNLPKTDCLAPEAAVEWCLENAAKLKEKYPGDQLAFIVHRYIASRSSAWVRADPENPVVEVHGTWGLPDGLQFCPFDIWDIHIPTEEITEYTNYKSNVLLLQADGTWRYQRVRNEIARFQSIGKADVLDIARRSHAIASRLKQPCHIMWFVGCTDTNRQNSNVPWYWTKAHSTENLDRGSHQTTVVRSTADLEGLAAIKRRHRRLAVVLRPDSPDLLRSNDFLESVAAAVRPLELPVVLQGSTLAHAFYQLTKHGCTVIADAQKDHLRARRQTNFGKLVRDGIPEKIARQQEQQRVATVPQNFRLGYLVGKFIEEILEAREAGNSELRAELADIFEVLRAVAHLSGETIDRVIAEADKKRSKVGGFEEGKVLVATSLPTAQSGTQLQESSVITGSQIEHLGPGAYRIPFSYLGFAEIGQPKVLDFAEADHTILLTLQRDCIELTMVRRPVQLQLRM